MNSTLKSVFTGMLIALTFATSVLAAPMASSEVLVADELQTLSKSIDKLVKQMEKQENNSKQDASLRKLDIAIAYLNFRSRRIEMFERELQSTRTKRNRLDDLLEQFQREEESLSQPFDSNQQESIRKAREELSLRQQAIADRMGRMDAEIILLENRIMDMQSQIDSVESFVQKNLEF